MAGCLRRIFLLATNKNLVNATCHRANYSAFRSQYSLEKIYPNSRLDITTVPQPPQSKDGRFSGFIPIDQLEITYSRSSGPGGQNVNCVDTKAEIRFQLANAGWIPEPIRAKLQEQMRNLTTKDGYIIVKSDKTRSQQLNLADAMEKLRNMIHKAADSLIVAQPSPASLEKHRRL